MNRWIKSLARSVIPDRRNLSPTRRWRQLRLAVELLEDRCVPADLTPLAVSDHTPHLIDPKIEVVHHGLSLQGNTRLLDGPMVLRDSDGYVEGKFTGLRFRVGYWDDFQNRWMDPSLPKNDKTWAFAALNLKFPGNDTAEAGTVFKQMMDDYYIDQTTGTNLDSLNNGIKVNIVEAINNHLNGHGYWAWLNDYNSSFATSGDYYAQLASKGKGGTFTADDNGDILRIKYVTHNNWVEFGIDPNFGGLLDPGYFFFTTGPKWTVSFDTVTTLDIQLPHRSGQGLRILSAQESQKNINVNEDNLDAWAVDGFVPSLKNEIAQNVAGTTMNLVDTLRGAVGQINGFLSSPQRFQYNQANYHVDWSADGTLYMDFLAKPWRTVSVSLDNIHDTIVGDPRYVHTEIKVQIGNGPLQDFNVGDPPIFQDFEGMRYTTVHVEVWQRATPIYGHLNGNGTEILWDDGGVTSIDPNTPTPPGGFMKFPDVPTGRLESVTLDVDYAWQAATGWIGGRWQWYREGGRYFSRWVGGTGVSAQSGEQLHIPGVGGAPDLDLTVTMDGTRNQLLDQIDPRDQPPSRIPPGGTACDCRCSSITPDPARLAPEAPSVKPRPP
jgi:hypothetical protein